MIPPLRAIGWTALGATIIAGLMKPAVSFSFAASIVALVLLSVRTLQPLRFFLVISLPFIVPLTAIHGFVNPQFSIGGKIWLLPYRPQGVTFALDTYCNLAILLAVATAWGQVDRDELFDWMVARRMPVFFVGVLAQSIATVRLIERRGQAVLKAQTARGIPTGPGWLRRIRALPAVILPVITSLINEADARSTALWSRGFLQYRFSGKEIPLGNICEIGWVGAAMFAPLALQFW